MNAITVTSKGQITLRKELMRHLGIATGDQISLEMLPGQEIRIRAVKPSGKISDVFGMLQRDGQPPVSIEAMNDAIAKGWAGRS